MTRISRIVVAGYPHHVIQRGNRGQNVFFSDEDKKKYRFLLMEEAKKAGITIWAYCLMSNHVHLIAVPEKEESLARGIGEAHRKYTRYVNFREGWRGYLWQGRFSSYPLNERHLFAAMRYVERNPVRAGLVEKAEEYVWSSAGAHVFNRKDVLLSDNFVTEEIKDWSEFIAKNDSESELTEFRRLSGTGRPMGDKNFIKKLETMTGRKLERGKPGPKRN